MDRSLPYRLHGIGHGQTAVIVGMDTYLYIGKTRFHHRQDLADLVGEEAAVGVAKHQAAGSTPGCRLQSGQGIFRVVPVATRDRVVLKRDRG